MNIPQRNEVFEQLQADCDDVCNVKGQDYASDFDVLDNFKRNATKTGLHPAQVWQVYFAKHIDAIDNAIKRNPHRPICKGEPLYGRIVDSINYLRLLACIVKEEDDKSNARPTEPLSFSLATEIVHPKNPTDVNHPSQS